MTNYHFRRVTNFVWAALAVALSVGPALDLHADDKWPDDVKSHRLSDTKQNSDSATAKTAGYRMTDRRVDVAFPRVPGVLLAELADAAIPATSEKTTPAAPRALPPIGADLDAIATPTAGLSELGGACTACETCGSQDTCLGCSTKVDCDSCDGNDLTCECRYRPEQEGWFQNTCVFIAGDGWKNIFDDDDNNNFGFRTGFNMGVNLPGQRAVRGQVGLSYGAYDLHGREGLLSRDDPIEQQVFGTAGVFKRSMVACGDRLAWGAVYDVMASESAGERADSLRLSQLRGYVGYAINERNEVGTWMAFRLMKDYAERQRVRVDTTDQANVFWHHTWKLGGDTTAYAGWADDPANVVVGLSGRVPLNNHAALFANVHYMIPSTTGGDVHPTIGTDDIFSQEAWNVSFGIMFYRGGKAVSRDVSGSFGMPLLPVADNATFSYQADML